MGIYRVHGRGLSVRLYHYCCSCSARHITARGFLMPHGADFFGIDLVWLTDQSVPDREGLGLTSHILKCDRLEHQYIADLEPRQVQKWLDSEIRRELSRDLTFHEFEDNRDPSTWWIATAPVFVVRNRAYKQARTVDAVDPGERVVEG